MRHFIVKTSKRLALATAAVVLLLAVAVGAMRLLVAQLPEYQAELQAYVAESLGLSLGFSRLDARLGLRGPELTFHEATLRAPDQPEPFLSARGVTVRLDLLALVRDRSVTVNGLILDGTHLILVRAVDGTLRLQGAPFDAASSAWEGRVPAEVEVAVRDSEVAYLDEATGASWPFSAVRGSLIRSAGKVTLEASARPPEALATYIEVAAEGKLAAAGGLPPSWTARASVRDARLEAVAAFLPEDLALQTVGSGDLAVRLAWAGDGLAQVAVEAQLDDVLLPAADDAAGAFYRHLRVNTEWTRAGEHGWRLALSDLQVNRNGFDWRRVGHAEVELGRDDAGLQHFSLSSDFVRLEDLTPALAVLPRPELLAFWLSMAPRGELEDVELAFTRTGGGWDYTVSGHLTDVAIEPVDDRPGFSGFTGELRADARSGRISIAARDLELDWPALFRAPLEADELTGVLVWRHGREAYRLVSDDLLLVNRDGTVRTNLELTWPLDGGSPTLDLEANVAGLDDITAVKRYLPARRMSEGLVHWLETAIAGGRAPSARVTWFGALAAFPFDAGDGQLLASVELEDGVLEFVEGWPRAVDLDGTVEFRNASFAARGRGRVLGNVTQDVRVEIDDLREPLLTVRGATSGSLSDVLAFLNGAPLITEHLGPDFARLQSSSGAAAVDLDLRLPLKDYAAYMLDGSVAVDDATLAVQGVAVAASDITGTLRFGNGTVSAEDLEAVLFGGPVAARLAIPGPQGFKAQVDVDGEIAAGTVIELLDLPFAERIAGQTRWHGRLLLPVRAAARAPLRIQVSSNLAGIALDFPAPLTKAPSEASGLRIDFDLLEGERLEVRGALGAARRFALELTDDGTELRLRRGTLRFGGEAPELPLGDGLFVEGALPTLDFDQWAVVARAGLDTASVNDWLLGLNLDVQEMTALGQQLGPARVGAQRGADRWLVDVESGPIAGAVSLPRNLSTRAQVRAHMERLQLAIGREGGLGTIDPRTLPSLRLEADAFTLGSRRLGRVVAEVEAEPTGLRLASFSSSSESLVIEGAGSWLQGARGPETQLAFSLRSSDVGAALTELGFDRFAEGQSAEITASVSWPGAPSGDWATRVSGAAALRVATGSLLDIEPGAGRVMGLMSITALPRRLSLDFRDVVNRGLVFDEITGDFTIADGNAYTDNLKLTGPVVEVGVAGRTGLRDRDYRQQAVVTSEPGRVLPAVGGLLAGPGVGAALLIFTQIFKEPLKGIGRASYCVTGSWDAPTVERLTAEQVQSGRLCADLPSDGVSMVAPR